MVRELKEAGESGADARRGGQEGTNFGGGGYSGSASSQHGSSAVNGATRLRTDGFELEMPQGLDVVPLERVRPERRIRLRRPVQILQRLPWPVVVILAVCYGPCG